MCHILEWMASRELTTAGLPEGIFYQGRRKERECDMRKESGRGERHHGGLTEGDADTKCEEASASAVVAGRVVHLPLLSPLPPLASPGKIGRHSASK